MLKKQKKVKKIRAKKETKLPIQMKKTEQAENKLLDDLINLTQGLSYTSETDAEIKPFIGKKAASLTQEEVLKQTKTAGEAMVAELTAADFFSTLTEIQDWFGEEETQIAQKFARLKEFLEQNLKYLKVFKIGQKELDVYILGLDAENTLAGVKTQSVET
jgi:hypothetical protein